MTRMFFHSWRSYPANSPPIRGKHHKCIIADCDKQIPMHHFLCVYHYTHTPTRLRPTHSTPGTAILALVEWWKSRKAKQQEVDVC